jgi:BMFP domain-containing protein YqiC
MLANEGSSMRKPTNFLEDATKIMAGAIETALAVRQQIVHECQLLSKRFVQRLDVVPRAELEIVRNMATLARMEQERLQERLNTLEGQWQAQQQMHSPAISVPGDRADALGQDQSGGKKQPNKSKEQDNRN